MGTNTLITRADGQIITQDWFNDFNLALRQDFVPRNASNVPTNLAGSIGTAALNWDKLYVQTIIANGTTLDVSNLTSLPNRIISGEETADLYPNFISVGTLSCNILGATTDLVMVVDSVNKTINTDIGFTATAGYTPSAANQALINEPSIGGTELTRNYGEGAPASHYISVDTMGATFTAIANSSVSVPSYIFVRIGTELILAEKLSNTQLKFLYRGIDGSARSTFADNAVIQLCIPTFVFTDGTSLFVTNLFPRVIAGNLPPASASGQYYLRLSDYRWYLDDGITVAAVDRHCLGAAVAYNATNTVSVYMPIWSHFDKGWRPDFNMKISNSFVNGTSVRIESGSYISVAGKRYLYENDVEIDCSVVSDRDGSTPAISAIGGKYIYVSGNNGKIYFSDTMPRKNDGWQSSLNRDLVGGYHPFKYDRCILWVPHTASVFNGFIHNEDFMSVVLRNSGSAVGAGSIINAIPSNFIPSNVRFLQGTFELSSWNVGPQRRLRIYNHYLNTSSEYYNELWGSYASAQAGNSWQSRIPSFSGIIKFLFDLAGSVYITDTYGVTGYYL